MFSEQEKINNIRKQFPFLEKKIYNKKWCYLDNAATTQKPKRVIDSIVEYYKKYNTNVHRGEYYISQLTTNFLEQSREKIRKFINANYINEIIFTKGTTESINLVASSIIDIIKNNDEIIISPLEHHSNIVPWKELCKKTGAIIRILPMDKKGNIQWDNFKNILSNKTKILAINQISNVLGIINPIKKIIEIIKKYNTLILIDGAQVPGHMLIDVKDLDVDFYTFSAHKMYGPTGVGILYGKKNILDKLPPYQYGGGMIKNVSFDKETIYETTPLKFEAGTPNICSIITWAAAIEFIEEIGIKFINLYEKELLKYTIYLLKKINGISIYGHDRKSSIVSFNLDKLHHFDIGNILNRFGISVRTGHHCAQPLMNFLNIKGTIRISIAIYNTFKEIDSLYKSILQAKKILQ